MKEYLRLPVLVLVSLLPLSVSAAIYKYIDENGRVAYSDKPVSGAETMKVQRASSKLDDEVATKVSDDNFDEYGEVVRYNTLQVLNPTSDQVINDSSGSVQVIFLPTPGLSKSHQLIINVNGKDVSRGRHSTLNLANLSRGSHTVSAKIVDNRGFLMIESDSVTFHVRDTGEDSQAYQ